MKDAMSCIQFSSEEQADSGLGLEAQRQRIVAYCTMKGLHLAEVSKRCQSPCTRVRGMSRLDQIRQRRIMLRCSASSKPSSSLVLPWRAPGRGKHGGYRVIHYPKIRQGVIWMLTLYPKNVRDKITSHVLREIR